MKLRSIFVALLSIGLLSACSSGNGNNGGGIFNPGGTIGGTSSANNGGGTFNPGGISYNGGGTTTNSVDGKYYTAINNEYMRIGFMSGAVEFVAASDSSYSTYSACIGSYTQNGNNITINITTYMNYSGGNSTTSSVNYTWYATLQGNNLTLRADNDTLNMSYSGEIYGGNSGGTSYNGGGTSYNGGGTTTNSVDGKYYTAINNESMRIGFMDGIVQFVAASDSSFSTYSVCGGTYTQNGNNITININTYMHYSGSGNPTTSSVNYTWYATLQGNNLTLRADNDTLDMTYTGQMTA